MTESPQETIERLREENSELRSRVTAGEVYLHRERVPGSLIVYKKNKIQALIDANERLISHQHGMIES